MLIFFFFFAERWESLSEEKEKQQLVKFSGSSVDSLGAENPSVARLKINCATLKCTRGTAHVIVPYQQKKWYHNFNLKHSY